jgi:hypothetical protein
MKTQSYIFLLFIIGTYFALNAQDRSDIGLNFSSNYTFRTLKTNDTDFQWLIDHRNEDEQAKFGFNVGGTYTYQFDKGLTIFTGIQYTRFGNTRRNILFQGPGGIDGRGSFQNSYGYIGVPLTMGYTYDFNGKWGLTAAVGAILSVLLDDRGSYIIQWSDGTAMSDTAVNFDNPHDFHRFHPLFKSSIGIHYKLRDAFHVKFEPTFQYSLMPIKDAPVHESLYSIGVNMGVHYILGTSKK